MRWKLEKLGNLLFESRISAIQPDPHRRIRVKLNVLGVEKRPVENEIEGATKQFIRKSGQFIYGKQNFHKGAFGIIPPELDGYETSADIPSFDLRDDCLPEWIFYYFKIGKKYKELEKVARGVGSKRIHPEQIADIEIPLPSIQEQNRIINELKTLESRNSQIDYQLTHQLNLIKQLRQSFLRKAMQGKLVAQNPEDEPATELLKKIKAEKEKLIAEKKMKKEKPLPPIKPEEIPFEIPENWVWCRLGEIALYSEAGKSYKCEEIKVSDKEWGVIKVSAVSWDVFLEEENKKYSPNKPNDITYQVKVGDFLISRANTKDLVGKSVIVKQLTKNLLLSDKTIRFRFSSKVSTEFINLCNNSASARVYYAIKGSGSSPSMKNITRDHMKELLIPLPPLPEQYRIVAKLEELMSYCDGLEKEIKSAKARNEEMMEEALREAIGI